MDGIPDVIGKPVPGTSGLYFPGPGDRGVNVGSVLGRAGDKRPQFIKEASPNGEVWRRLDSADFQEKENKTE